MRPEIKHSTQDKFLEPEKLDPAFKSSIRKAKKSGIPTVIAQAENNYGRWLMSDRQRRYGEAVPLFREVAEIQEAEFNMGEAAQAYHMLSSCLFLMGGVDDLKKAEEVVKKALELYPDSEEFMESKQSAIIQHISILGSLNNQTGNIDYFIQGQRICEQNAQTIQGNAVRRQLALSGFIKD
jgi:tetratricopeptide (TPR) repeat protein